MSKVRVGIRRATSRMAPLAVTASVVGLLLMLSASSAVAAAYGPHDKVTICHNGHEITVSRNAEHAFIDRGDSLGVCP